MKRYIGTTVRGIRTPILNEGDALLTLLPEIVVKAGQSAGFAHKDLDILAITESVVARAQGNYATVDEIAQDIRDKFPEGCRSLGLLFPILSRNRFAILLKAMARAMDQLVIQCSYPSDEVGNPLFLSHELLGKDINPWQDVLDEERFTELFGPFSHPFTGLDYLAYYREIVEAEGCQCRFVFANDPRVLASHAKDILCCDIHSRAQNKAILRQESQGCVLGLDDILVDPSTQHGYNEAYGLLGSNKADDERVKLFPRDCQAFVDQMAKALKEVTGKQIEVMIYGDGAFKDPVGKIWELADPMVSPAFTKGLDGLPNEIKLKFLADAAYHDCDSETQARAIVQAIRDKDKDLMGDMAAEGTTPRKLSDLLGTLADLTSGSGDKGTPIVYIQGYFDNYADD